MTPQDLIVWGASLGSSGLTAWSRTAKLAELGPPAPKVCLPRIKKRAGDRPSNLELLAAVAADVAAAASLPQGNDQKKSLQDRKRSLEEPAAEAHDGK